MSASFAGSSCPVIVQTNPNVQRSYDYDGLNRLQAYEKYDGGGTGAVTDSASYSYDGLDRVTKEIEKHVFGRSHLVFRDR